MARNQDREMCTYKTEKQIYHIHIYIYIHIYMVLIEMSTTLTETRASTVLYACFFLGGGREFCR